MSNDPWWQRYVGENVLPEFSPENRIAMQLAPLHIYDFWFKLEGRIYARLWWLQWYARPDLRAKMPSYRGELWPEDILPEFWEQIRSVERTLMERIGRSFPVPIDDLPILIEELSDHAIGYQASQCDEAGLIAMRTALKGPSSPLSRFSGYCDGPQLSPLYEQWLQDNVDWELLPLRYVVTDISHPPEWMMERMERHSQVQARANLLLITPLPVVRVRRAYRSASNAEREVFKQEASFMSSPDIDTVWQEFLSIDNERS